MTSSMVSRWPVVVEAVVAAGDRDDHGALTPVGLERLFHAGWCAYVERCPTLEAAGGAVELLAERHGGACEAGDRVDVAVGASELFATRLHVGMRVRGGSCDLGVDATWSVAVGAVTPALRDELIALAHGATSTL